MKENMNANQKQQPMVQVAPVLERSPVDNILSAMEWYLKRAEEEASRIGNCPIQSNLHLLRRGLEEAVSKLSAPARRGSRYLPNRHPARKASL